MTTILTKEIPRKRISKGTHEGYGSIRIEDLALGSHIGEDCAIRIEVCEYVPEQNNSEQCAADIARRNPQGQ